MKRIRYISTLALLGLIVVVMAMPSQAYVLTGRSWNWLGGSPITVNMKVNPNCADATAPNELASLQSAMQTWTDCGADFAFYYAGPTSVTGASYNGQNDMCWNSGSSGGALATTYTWFIGSNITQADVVFWDGPWTWNTNWPTYTQFDVESVGLHELGHVLGLDHSQYNWAVMWYSINWGEVQRDLSSDDIDGAIAIYGSSGGPSLSVTVTPTGSVNIPSSGGSIPYDLTVHNNTGSTVYFDGWSEFEQVGGSYTQLVIFRPDIWVPGGNTIARSAVLTVSGTVPDGTYDYFLRAGDYYAPTIIDEDSFQFFKYGGDGSAPWIAETFDTGWGQEGVQLEWAIPDHFQVTGAYPNPFNPETTIEFDLPEASHVALSIYDLQGRLVAEVVDGTMDAGHYGVTWNAAEYSSGTYIYRLSSDAGEANGKLVLLK